MAKLKCAAEVFTSCLSRYKIIRHIEQQSSKFGAMKDASLKPGKLGPTRFQVVVCSPAQFGSKNSSYGMRFGGVMWCPKIWVAPVLIHLQMDLFVCKIIRLVGTPQFLGNPHVGRHHHHPVTPSDRTLSPTPSKTEVFTLYHGYIIPGATNVDAKNSNNSMVQERKPPYGSKKRMCGVSLSQVPQQLDVVDNPNLNWMVAGEFYDLRNQHTSIHSGFINQQA